MGIPGTAGDASRKEAPRFTSDSLLQAVFLAGSNPVFLIEMQTRKILACTGDIVDVFGYHRPDLVGSDTRILHVDQASYEAFDDSSRAVLDTSDNYHGHTWMRRRDGSVFYSEHLVQVIRDDAAQECTIISIVRDLTGARQDTLNALGTSNDELPFRSLREHVPGAVYQQIEDLNGTDRFTYLAGTLFQHYGLDADAVRTDPEAFYGCIVPTDRKVLESKINRARVSMASVECEIRMDTPAAGQVTLRIVTQPRKLDDGSLLWDGFALDITTERRAEEQLQYLSKHDALTGLLNRGQFLRQVEHAIGQLGGKPRWLAVATVDVQGMTRINAVYGLERGDGLLAKIGGRLQEHLSRHDFAARGHGNVFFVMMRLRDDNHGVSRRLSRLARVFDEPFHLDDGTLLSASARIGIATHPTDASDAATLVSASTIALDRAPHGHQVGYEFYSEELGHRLRQRMVLEKDLADGIAAGELVPFFQPQISLADGSLTGLEALVRWCKPDGRLISPAEFIPLAEKSGLIPRLDIAVMKAVITQIRQWQDMGLDPPPVAVNCSARQFRGGHLARACKDTLHEGGIDPSLLVIEMTESSLLDDYQAAEKTMAALTEIGVQFAIDDFGTGFSSLNYVAHLPFHTLKIDRSFIAMLGIDDRQTAICDLLVNMGATLGLKVVAEGVEEQSQATYLMSIGCPAAQGFLFAKPMPAAEVSAWL